MAKSGGVGVRVAITLRPELDSYLVSIAKYQNRPKTAVINDFLMDSLDVFKDVSDAYSAIERGVDPKNILNQLAAKTLQKVGDLGNELVAQEQSKSEKCPDTLELPL
jgi:predicted transcriptional regulator